MKFFGILYVCLACFIGGTPGYADAFVFGLASSLPLLSSSSLSMKNNNFDANAYAKSMSAAAIDQMKNLKPGDLDKMIAEIDSMGGVQKAALKAMNMDVSFGIFFYLVVPDDSYPFALNFVLPSQK
jgi:hypothetical protein